MASAVNVGSINLPKMMRHIKHRTSQVRDLTFMRDAIHRKETKTTGTTSGTEGSGTALSGPAVNFGYETSSYAQQNAGVNTAYHVNSPEIVLPGLTMLQSPIKSRSGKLERMGHRISGSCIFYAPSLDYVKALDNFKDTKAFAELESYDKLYDIERIIQNPTKLSAIDASGEISVDDADLLFTFADALPGYEIDRIRFRIKATGSGTTYFNAFSIKGNEGGSDTWMNWLAEDAGGQTDPGTGVPLTMDSWLTVDLPLRLENLPSGDTGTEAAATFNNGLRTSVYKDGTQYEFWANNEASPVFDLDKLFGDSTNELKEISFGVYSASGTYSVYVEDIYLYKEAEWRIESIKDYRDEYMQLAAVRVRGDRASRRRAYG